MAPMAHFNEEMVETLLRGSGQSSPGWASLMATAELPRILWRELLQQPWANTA